MSWIITLTGPDADQALADLRATMQYDQLDATVTLEPWCETCRNTRELVLGDECGNLAGCLAICGDCAPETVGDRGVW